MLPAVVSVCPLDDYRLHIKFDSGEAGVLDVRKLLDFGLFSQLRDPEVFRKVRVAFDTVEWEVGVDLDPEFVHSNTICPDRTTVEV